MAPKNPKFALFLMENPPSAEVVRADDFQPARDMPRIDVGQERSVLKGKAKVEVKGRILHTGTQSAMRKLRVTRAGEVHEEEVPGTEYLLSWYIAQQQQKKARERNLAEQDNLLYREGPQGPPAAEAPAPIRTPIKRAKEVLDALQLKLDSLPCFEERPGDVQLNECSPVFMNGALLHYYFRSYKQPIKLFRKILKHLLSQEVLRDDGYSLEGKCDSVAIPEKLISAITAYVSTNTGADEAEFSPMTIVGSYVYNSRDEKYKRRSKAPRSESAGSSAGSTETSTETRTTPTSTSGSAPSSSNSISSSTGLLPGPHHPVTTVGFQPRNLGWQAVSVGVGHQNWVLQGGGSNQDQHRAHHQDGQDGQDGLVALLVNASSSLFDNVLEPSPSLGFPTCSRVEDVY